MMWDDEVDVVCCGSGLGALAAAIAAIDADLDVVVVRRSGSTPRRRADERAPSVAPWLDLGIDDAETREYLDALVADQETLSQGARDADIVIRALTEPAPAAPGAPVETFHGARLREWAGQCLLSPYGLLYTRLTDRGGVRMETGSGEIIEANVLGSFEIGSGVNASAAANDWLRAQARERDIPILEDSALERIVFEEGEIVGVVIATSDGPRAVRVRHGIAVSTATEGDLSEGVRRTDDAQTLQVALVGRNASRFSRIELLSILPNAAHVRHRDGNRVPEGRSNRSHARRS